MIKDKIIIGSSTVRNGLEKMR